MDQFLAQLLRPHQRLGVQFLYDCVTGARHAQFHGAILADDMGLGKTLQSIALVWTLLKQGRTSKEKSVCQRAVIVCPATLVKNWEREFRKWLGGARCIPLVVASAASKSNHAEQQELVATFVQSGVRPVLIVSYDLLRKHAQALAQAPALLLVMDEGHRLKNQAGNKTMDSLAVRARPSDSWHSPGP